MDDLAALLTAIAALISAFAWPAAFVVLLLLFRPQMRDLISRLVSAKAGPVEVTFADLPKLAADAAEVVQELTTEQVPSRLGGYENKALGPQLETRGGDPAGIPSRLPRGERPVFPADAPVELLKLAERAPVAAVIGAWTKVIEAAEKAAQHFGVDGVTPSEIAAKLGEQRPPMRRLVPSLAALEEIYRAVSSGEVQAMRGADATAFVTTATSITFAFRLEQEMNTAR
jgi:hypothetical protein